MATLLLIHGPNLNKLGARDPEHYGTITLESIEQLVADCAQLIGYEIVAYQSNHEGALIDWIQDHAGKAVGVIINPGALTHYSYALHDCLSDTQLPCIEVHLSDIKNRELWRQVSVIEPSCIAQISGKRQEGYIEAVKILHEFIKAKQ